MCVCVYVSVSVKVHTLSFCVCVCLSTWQAYTDELVDLHRRLMDLRERNVLQQVCVCVSVSASLPVAQLSQ